MDIINMTSLPDKPMNDTVTKYGDAYEKILPVNLVLAITIIFQNTFVIYDYFPDRRKIITTLFILIAVADILIAVSEMVHVGLAIACICDNRAYIPVLLYTTFSHTGQFAWTCSAYYNLVLTVLRTVTLARPFEGVNKRVVIIAVISGTIFWFLVVFSGYLDDLMHMSSSPALQPTCNWMWLNEQATIEIVGYLVTWVICYFHMRISRGVFEFLVTFPLIAAYAIPCLITLVCIPIQAYHLRKSLSASAYSDVSRDSDHITITIILVSSLFVVSTGFQSTGFFLLYFSNEVFLLEVVMFTLPLLNGVGFPLIIILRKPALRERFKGYILAPVRLLIRAVSALIARYHGYQEIEL